jgi:hypothetical protein
MKSVFLISCTKSKQPYACTAEDMYKPSTQYRAALAFALNRVDNKNEQIFILSAKYGLLSLTDQIETYNETLIGKPRSVQLQWGKKVIKSIAERFDINSTNFIILAGRTYVSPLIPYLRFYETPLVGKRMGEAVSWMQRNAITNKGVSIVSSAIRSYSIKTQSAEPLDTPKSFSQAIVVQAKDLRDKRNLNRVPNDKPGWYRWWAPEKALALLLNSQYISKEYLEELKPYFSKGSGVMAGYFCIYVGVAVKESIQARLNWHVNQRHTDTCVQCGTLSTFRQSIASLMSGNQHDEVSTNYLIDMLAVEYSTVDYPIKSQQAKEAIEQIERDEIARMILPLNIKHNNHSVLKAFTSELKAARKRSK